MIITIVLLSIIVILVTIGGSKTHCLPPNKK